MKPGETSIYALSGPDGAIRYIGKSVNPKSRLESHTSPGQRNITPVAQWCRMLKKHGKRPVMAILETCLDWEAAERKWIARYRAEGADLLNLQDGGIDPKKLMAFRGKFPAFAWAMRFCGRQKRTELAAILRARATEAKTIGGDAMANFDRHLRDGILAANPFVRF